MGFQSQLLMIVAIIAIFLNSIIVFYFAYLGYKMATATDEQKRKAAKTRMFNTLVSFVLILILVGMLYGIDFMNGNDPLTGGTMGLTPDPPTTISAGSGPIEFQVTDGDGISTRHYWVRVIGGQGAITATQVHLPDGGGTRIILTPSASVSEATQVTIQLSDRYSGGTMRNFTFTVS